jgi:hypothetical protein
MAVDRPGKGPFQVETGIVGMLVSRRAMLLLFSLKQLK